MSASTTFPGVRSSRLPLAVCAVLAGCFSTENAMKIERLDGNRIRRYTNCAGVTVIVLANRLARIEGPLNPGMFTPAGRKFAADTLRAWRMGRA
jgi:hypothetical protein